ncbi:hypothetical protein CKA32_005359 [Geitlerinema sp. FC II]|nr:hypothetical protein CKA32_005359 [Geitlerinema sp. FC II]
MQRILGVVIDFNRFPIHIQRPFQPTLLVVLRPHRRTSQGVDYLVEIVRTLVHTVAELRRHLLAVRHRDQISRRIVLVTHHFPVGVGNFGDATFGISCERHRHSRIAEDTVVGKRQLVAVEVGRRDQISRRPVDFVFDAVLRRQDVRAAKNRIGGIVRSSRPELNVLSVAVRQRRIRRSPSSTVLRTQTRKDPVVRHKFRLIQASIGTGSLQEPRNRVESRLEGKTDPFTSRNRHVHPVSIFESRQLSQQLLFRRRLRQTRPQVGIAEFQTPTVT